MSEYFSSTDVAASVELDALLAGLRDFLSKVLILYILRDWECPMDIPLVLVLRIKKPEPCSDEQPQRRIHKSSHENLSQWNETPSRCEQIIAAFPLSVLSTINELSRLSRLNVVNSLNIK